MGVKMEVIKEANVNWTREETQVIWERWTYERAGTVEEIVFLKVRTLDAGMQTIHIKCKNVGHARRTFNNISKAHVYG